MQSIEAYVLAKKYTDKSIAGAGGLKGAPCEVQSIVDIPGGHRITLSWQTDQGETETDSFDVMDGQSPAISEETGNALIELADGWYVADVQGVEISKDSANILEQEQDGLFVTGVTSVDTDENGTLFVTYGPIETDYTCDYTLYLIATNAEIDALFNNPK